MTMVYVNWEDQIVASEERMKEIEHEYFEEAVKRLCDSPSSCFEDWLNEDYSAYDIFEMSINDKAILKMGWLQWVQEQARTETLEAMRTDWEKVRVE